MVLDISILVLVYILFFLAAIGCFIPVIPGVPLIFFVCLGYGFYDRWESFGLATMIVMGVLAAGSIAAENLATAYGAKHFGSGRAGMIGSVVGAIAGVLIFNIPGLIVGTFLGALLFEMLFSKKELKEAAGAGAGALLGCLGGSIFKFFLSVIMISVFSYLVFSHGIGSDESKAPAADPAAVEAPAADAPGTEAPETEAPGAEAPEPEAQAAEAEAPDPEPALTETPGP